LPRGLGDNPLKREKKLRRSSSRPARSGPSAPATDQASGLPVGIAGPGDAHTSATTASYNDVFFHRRPEELASGPAIVPEATHEVHEETHIEPPVEAPVTAPVPAAPDPVTEVLPVQAFDAPTPVPVETVQPTVAIPAESPADHPAEAPSAPAALDESQPAPAVAADAEKKGFFGRIFGKWKKS
jgi:hypothetical protein